MSEHWSGPTSRAIRRRGILAAAGAGVAGVIAKQSAQPVLAANVTLDINQSSTGNTNITGPGAFTPWDAEATAVFSANNTSGLGAGGNNVGLAGSGALAGVRGKSLVNGVWGTATAVGGSGVFGEGTYGVYGTGAIPTDTGVHGDSPSGYGVSGASATNAGVYGTSVSGAGVEGLIPAASSAANTIGVFGNNLSGGAGGVGVYGSCANGTGVYGQTSVSNQYGVLGTTYATNSTAIAGTCTGNGSSAFSGGTTNPNAFGAVFQGNVVIQGRLVVSDPSYKSGALQHPDGSHRLVYCVESPESWIEDVGKGQLVDGKTTVTFDKDFTALTHTDDYHVFLTLYGEGDNGINVTERRLDGFTVKERKGGTGNQAFSWKVMVKAKSTVKSERLGRFTMPTIPLPDVSKFKAPEMPVAAVPKKP